MSETSPTDTTGSKLTGRFRDRKTRKLTRRYQESLEDGEYSPSGFFSSPKMGRTLDTEDSAPEESVDNDDFMTMGAEGDGYITNDDFQDGKAGTQGREQPMLQDSAIDLFEDVLDQPTVLSGQGRFTDDSAIEDPEQPTSPREVGIPNTGPPANQISGQSLHARKEKTTSEGFALGEKTWGRAITAATGSRKRKRSTASTESNHDLDFVEYNEEPINLDFSRCIDDPFVALEARIERQRNSTNNYDHGHPSSFPSAPSFTSTITSGRLHLPYLSISHEEPTRPKPHSANSVVVHHSNSVRSTPAQPEAAPPPPSTTPPTSKAFEDVFTDFLYDDRLALASWGGTDGLGIIPIDEPLSLRNCATNLLELNRSKMEETQAVQSPWVDQNVIAPDRRVRSKTVDNASRTRLDAYHERMKSTHFRGGNPAWEAWRRENDPAWELCCVRDEQAHLGYDPVPFLDPFDDILGYHGDDYAEDSYSLQITPVFRSLDSGYWSDEETFFREKNEEMRLRGGALPEPQGEMGLDANDLAASEDSVDLIKEPAQDEPSEQPVSEKPNGGPANQQPVQESGSSSKGKEREQRIEKSERELVDVSRHISVGEDMHDSCWCVGMQEIDAFRYY
ncbi:hypothetical protein V8E51_019215 [Hyaloscypha variabilis]